MHFLRHRRAAAPEPASILVPADALARTGDGHHRLDRDLAGAGGPEIVGASADAPEVNPATHRYYRSIVAYTVDAHEYQIQGAYSMRPSTTQITEVGGVVTTEMRIDPLPYSTGQKVSLRYDPAAPANAIVIDRTRELTVFALQIFCGLMSMILGLLVLYANGNLAWLGPEWHH
jgi:hypothetical protein